MGACGCRRRLEASLPVEETEVGRVEEEPQDEHEQLLANRPPSDLLEEALMSLARAYAGTGFGDDTADWEGFLSVDNVNGFSNSALYGEVSEQDFAELLYSLGLRPPAKVIDLGCGTGKLVNLAALLGFRAAGIELEPGRYQRACTAAKALRLAQAQQGTIGQSAPPSFICANFLEYDLSDADMVWANSVVFGAEMMEAVAAQARKMRPGSLVVSHKLLPGPGFQFYREASLRVSWRPEGGVVFQVQKVLGEDGGGGPT